MNVTIGNEDIPVGVVQAGMHVIWDRRVHKVMLTQPLGFNEATQSPVVGIILQDDEGNAHQESLSSSYTLTRIKVRIEL